MSSCACMYSFFVGIFRIDFYFDKQMSEYFTMSPWKNPIIENITMKKSDYLEIWLVGTFSKYRSISSHNRTQSEDDIHSLFTLISSCLTIFLMILISFLIISRFNISIKIARSQVTYLCTIDNGLLYNIVTRSFTCAVMSNKIWFSDNVTTRKAI